MSKTHIDRLRNPNYLGGWDLLDSEGKPIIKTVTIKEVKSSEVFSQKANEMEEVITVHFEECKPIILNSINRKRLKTVTKEVFIENMIGKKIQLTSEHKKYFGEMMDVVRIVKKSSDAITKAQTKKKPSLDDSRFKQALDALESGAVTAEKLKKNYNLKEEQIKQIDEAVKNKK